MKIIDVHIHFSNIDSFIDTANNVSKLHYSNEGLHKEFKAANVVLGIGMGVTETKMEGFPDTTVQTPMGLDLEPKLPKSVVYCSGINPYTLDSAALNRLEEVVLRPEVVGIKIYLGYYPFYTYDKIYQSVYRLAAKYGLPVVFHTGDTYSERGLLKYSHPLTIDEVAVKHRDVNFMMAHFGDPWTLDAAEVVYKNRNVYADLSGLVVGTGKDVKRYKDSPRFFNHLKHALTFTDNYHKFLFGTDWPLVQIQPYIDFIKVIIPEEYHEEVFYNTALKVFPKIKKFL